LRNELQALILKTLQTQVGKNLHFSGLKVAQMGVSKKGD